MHINIKIKYMAHMAVNAYFPYAGTTAYFSSMLAVYIGAAHTHYLEPGSPPPPGIHWRKREGEILEILKDLDHVLDIDDVILNVVFK